MSACDPCTLSAALLVLEGVSSSARSLSSALSSLYSKWPFAEVLALAKASTAHKAPRPEVVLGVIRILLLPRYDP